MRIDRFIVFSICLFLIGEYSYSKNRIVDCGNFELIEEINSDSVKKATSYSIELFSGIVDDNKVPFWLRSNQYGAGSLSGLSCGLRGSASRNYQVDKFIDWGFSFSGRLNTGKTTEIIIYESFLKARIGAINFLAGRTKQITGITDSTLSTGSFSISGNALGIPKVEISIQDYYPIKALKNFVSIKGNFAHGFLGSVDLTYDVNVKSAKTYFHQKSLYIRLGKPFGKISLLGGFNHQVFFGSQKQIYGSRFNMSPLQVYSYVLTGKTATARQNGLESGKIGNHLGSIDIGLQIIYSKFSLLLYRQNIYDVGALARLANITDGLNGFQIVNRSSNDHHRLRWNKILLEYFYSRSQAGEPNARFTKSGDENYYNGFYATGWSYKGKGLGTPFISAKHEIRKEFPNDPSDFFSNNRVLVLHAAADLTVGKLAVISKVSYSRNYGTYGTSPFGHSLGRVRRPSHGIFPKTNQLSSFIEITKQFRKNYYLKFQFANDYGKLLYNSTGLIISLTKSIN